MEIGAGSFPGAVGLLPSRSGGRLVPLAVLAVFLSARGTVLGQGESIGSVSFVAADAAWDLARGRAYLTAKARKEIVALDLTSGASATIHTSVYMPESIAVTPDGRWLYAALLTREHDPGWFDEEGHEAYIAELDLEGGGPAREFRITEDPFDLAVTDGQVLVVPGGSGQHTNMKTFDAVTGNELGHWYIPERCLVALHPSQEAAYAADTQLMPSDIWRYAIDPLTGAITDSWESRYHGDHPMDGNVFPDPDGSRVFSRGGGIYTSDAVKENDLLYLRMLDTGPFEAMAFDPPRRAIFALAANQLRFYNSVSLERVSHFITQGRGAHAAADAEHVYVLSISSAKTLALRFPNPAIGGDSNTPPAADFTWDPASPTTATEIRFDASPTADAQDPSESLRFRWDWDGDGTYDTSFVSATEARHLYTVAGTKDVVLQAKDSLGLVAEARKQVHVTRAGGPGPAGQAEVLFELDFAAEDLVFDGERGRLYATDGLARMVEAGLDTGFVVRRWEFAMGPGPIAMAPGGDKIFVGLHAPVPAGGYPSGPGGITAIDLELGEETRGIELPASPSDIAVTALGVVIAAGDGGVRAYDGETWSPIGDAEPVGVLFRLALHPSGVDVYGATLNMVPPETFHFPLDPVTNAVTGHWYSRYAGHPAMGNAVFVTPDGKRLITGGGGLFTSSPVEAEDMLYLRTLAVTPIEGAAFDSPRQAMFAVTGTQLVYLNLESLETVSAVSTVAGSRFTAVLGDRVYVGSVGAKATVIQAIDNPAAGSEGNKPPVADFTWSPEAPTTATSILFDAGSSSDPEDPLEDLVFRWDWDGDGAFDTEFERTLVTASHGYTVAGTKLVILEVKDSRGLVGSVRKAVDVGRLIDPADIEAHPAWELMFPAADIVLEPSGRHLYAGDAGGEAIVEISTDTGFIERRWDLDRSPGPMALSPSGRRLYALLAGEEDAGGKLPCLVEIDIEAGVETARLPLDFGPCDLVATDSRMVVVSPLTMKYDVVALNLETGICTGSLTMYQGLRLALHPSQRVVYAVLHEGSTSYTFHLALEAAGTLVRADQATWFPGDSRTFEAVVSPDGTLLAAGGGYLFALSEDPSHDMALIGQLAFAGISSITFDLPRRAVFGVRQSQLCYSNADSLQIAQCFAALPDARHVWALPDRIYTASITETRTAFEIFSNPAIGAETNTPPVPDFTWVPDPPSAGEEIRFDASGSADAQDPASSLQFRWDWDDFGGFDTKFTSSPVATHTYPLAGTKVVQLQVKDSHGSAALVRKRVEVSSAQVPVAGVPYTAFEIPFMVQDLVFDPSRPVLYVVAGMRRLVAAIRLPTGRLWGTWEFDRAPMRLAIAPGGGRLCATLADATAEGVPTGPGFSIAVIDLERGRVASEFQVDTRPYHIAATDGGIVIVSSGEEDPEGALRSFDARSGSELGRRSAMWRLQLCAHPGGGWLYGAELSSLRDIYHFVLDPSTGSLSDGWEAARQSDHPRGSIHVHPSGAYLLTSGGGVYTSAAEPSADLQFLTEFSHAREATDVAFLPHRGRYAVIYNEPGTQVVVHDDATHAVVETLDLPSRAATLFLGAFDDVVYAVTDRTTSARVDAVSWRAPLPFVRGDPNASGSMDVADAVSIIGYAYAGQPESARCLDAADADDNGKVDVTDAIRILLHLFRGEAGPAAPAGHPPQACGLDPTPDPLDCSEYDPCQ